MSIARAPYERTDDTTAVRATPAEAATAAVVPLIAVRAHGPARRTMDVAFAGLALVLLLPLLVAIAVLVATTSRGPVLYRQQRIGTGGRPFVIVKFRTMRIGADDVADEVFAQQDDGSGPLNKIHDDPRVTAPGRWLRRLSLDELPQLWNVLSGSMALVGPRPTTPREVARFAPLDYQRLAVRPGITGITQVSGRSDLDWSDAIRMDLNYVENRTLRLDLLILLRTVPAVVLARGAY
ncbi:sugar transferase [Nocardioides sp. MH1]|uniref:sugar transferase n=1 Tax=Nocardioides sp. MH1 TaxID=3242490 RepID=UPI0035203DC1